MLAPLGEDLRCRSGTWSTRFPTFKVPHQFIDRSVLPSNPLFEGRTSVTASNGPCTGTHFAHFYGCTLAFVRPLVSFRPRLCLFKMVLVAITTGTGTVGIPLSLHCRMAVSEVLITLLLSRRLRNPLVLGWPKAALAGKVDGTLVDASHLIEKTSRWPS